MTPQQAADRLLAAFAAHDTAGYFACFAGDATFLFHTTPGLLRSRSDYEQLWYGWESDGFRVLSCTSSDQDMRVYGDTAIFTHSVRTIVFSDGAEQTLTERETIVFRHDGDQWLAVHEHLSGDPS
ncbi:YybH family protein [Actinoplanes derwentensis]|uniref:Ketosteroid isomerase homolog n=1 Tax=Actinoplanes derwentensis TaxID=113562 RepID=A0A1H1VYU0_9ACTN|nr:nuclear transport factor 2 family protein [Actinoplanes derwentensis]GID83993.1 hypothetical protein Ade03nite_29170 [Actinoplanes derwentensis]SDS90004.1 Ketosteroid isomerase homolog [Actinoplanes derwentensis]